MRTARASALLVALVLVLGPLSSCGGGGDGNPPSTDPRAETPGISTVTPSSTTPEEEEARPVTIASLDGNAFISTSIRGVASLDGAEIDLAFSRSALTATVGCAVMEAPYQVSSGRISWRISPTSTPPPIPCGPQGLERDSWLRAALLLGFDAEFEGEDLRLSSTGIDIVLEPAESTPAPPGLYGTLWTLETAVIDEAPRGPAVATAAPQVRFDGIGTAFLTTGCNQGTVSVDLGIEFGETSGFVGFSRLGITRLGCDGAAGEIEDAIADVFAGEGVITLADGLLTLTRGSTSLIYRAGPS